MHATIPALPNSIRQLVITGSRAGELSGELTGLFDRLAGRLVAQGMAKLIELGFGFLICEGLSDDKAERARAFFEENFVIRDPNAEGGIRYYQGKILIRTRKPEDDMNIYLRCCPDSSRLYRGDRLRPSVIVTTEVLSEDEAEQLERDPERVDLVIRFKDIKAILGLIERPDTHVVQLLLENQVQLSGNFGHLFKFGAIAKNVELALTGAE
ncbi:MAG: hypothetical protein ABW168_29660 [Sedimenticola sp.]